jgi:hypothetical protein
MADDGARHGILRGFQLGPTLGNGTFDGTNSPMDSETISTTAWSSSPI